ncbi:hypothetical protein FB451DRAFT_1256903 [Mycena latifolia]|nr:hypothetical protein FB451DRAFT_1256903 [Mycena latifolia]
MLRSVPSAKHSLQPSMPRQSARQDMGEMSARGKVSSVLPKLFGRPAPAAAPDALQPRRRISSASNRSSLSSASPQQQQEDMILPLEAERGGSSGVPVLGSAAPEHASAARSSAAPPQTKDALYASIFSEPSMFDVDPPSPSDMPRGKVTSTVKSAQATAHRQKKGALFSSAPFKRSMSNLAPPPAPVPQGAFTSAANPPQQAAASASDPLEALARLQLFDGCFSLEVLSVIKLTTDLQNVRNAFPAGATDGLVATVLAMAFLATNLGASEDRESWEGLHEKAQQYVEAALRNLGSAETLDMLQAKVATMLA